MVPAAFVFLDKFPLTNNGKIDRKALPAPELDRPELGASLVAPRTAVEHTLASIWAKVLRLERVGVQDNFFELGGDSILTIQIVSLARQAGLALSPKLLFQHQTIAELAGSVAPEAQQRRAEQGLVQGAAPLTPIQHWFFEQSLAEPHHYNQAFLFRVTESLEMKPLASALALLERHHDALRLRFATTSQVCEQTFAPPSTAVPLEQVDLSATHESEVLRRIESDAARAQATLDFTRGPVWRAVYFDLGAGRPGRLLLAVHHLAVDGVSWRILIEDLERAYFAEKAGQPVEFPAKTTSVKEWAQQLVGLVNSGAVPGGGRYWQHMAFENAGGFQVELSAGENTEGSVRTITTALTETETETLLLRAASAYNTQINDLLLAALGKALSEWTGAENITINLEGHGREDLFDGVDLSRTVGWFTSIYPVCLHLPGQGIPELVKSVKEQLREIPAHGIGFGLQRYLVKDPLISSEHEPQILFNYLGQFDQVVGGSRLFSFAPELIGPWHSPLARRRHLLEVNCLVVNGRLECRWSFSENRHRAKTIEKLARAFLSRLSGIIQHCASLGARSGTPSDFPLISLDQNALDGLLERIPDLDDIYPLSPIQTLFYSAGANDSTLVTDQWHGTLVGPLDLDRFRRAWELVFERHPVLRTSFQTVGLPEPLQVVHRGVRSAWGVEDWQGVAEQERAARWAKLLESDRGLGMNLAQPPLSRLAVIQLDAQRWKFLWTVPALLLDGWSWPLVFRELSLIYESLCRSQSAVLSTAMPYRNYVAWIQSRQWAETEDFWRGMMSGVIEPTPLLVETVAPPPIAGRRHQQWSLTLDPLLTSNLVQMARQLQITSNAIIQATWALVLAGCSGRSDVVFGVSFSGRPADLQGAEDIVGPFVNNLPVRVRLNESLSVRGFLQQIHNQSLRLTEHQFAPLARIQSWTGVSWRHRLFDSIVVVQNYLVDAAARRLGGLVVISDFVGPVHSNVPLLVLVEPETAWRVTLIYDAHQLPGAAIQRWGQDFVRVLAGFAADLDLGLGALLPRPCASTPFAPAKPRSRASSQNYFPPQTELEQQLARVWEAMLQIEKISAEENIFDLGAHSLLVVQLHRCLCETIGREFPLVAMFQFPTIRGLAACLSRKDTAERSAAEIQTRARLQGAAIRRLRSADKRG
jgi:non-ribosomal peptide synthase protein (TIGR01720 family)